MRFGALAISDKVARLYDHSVVTKQCGIVVLGSTAVRACYKPGIHGRQSIAFSVVSANALAFTHRLFVSHK